MMKLRYKPVGMLVGAAGGILAGAIFKRAGQPAAGEDEAAKATDAAKVWPQALMAAALQGAIFAVASAAVGRLAAQGTRSLTGIWPGEDSSAQGGGAQKKKA